MKKTNEKKNVHILKNAKQKLIAGLSIFTVLTNSFAFAVSSKDIEKDKNEKDQVTDKINETKKELDTVNSQKDEKEQEVNNLNSQINNYESQIKELDAKIQKSNEEIAETTKELDELQNKILKSKELLDQRLLVMYQNGETSMLDFILGSESLSDFISKYTAAEQIATYDQKLIKQVEEEKAQREKLKQELDAKVEDLQATKTSRTEVVNQLNEVKGQKQIEVNELNSTAEELINDIDEYEKQAKELDAEIKRKEEALQQQFEDAKDKNEANNGGSGATSSVNFIAPISGYKITTGLYYSDGRYHGAVDYSGAGIYGKPVKAVADGIVIEAKELNYSYGRYVIIKHFNGLYTLYAHGSALNVKYGQEVKQGQTILYVGSSGNSTGPHLHFEVRTSSSYSSRVNPLKYLP